MVPLHRLDIRRNETAALANGVDKLKGRIFFLVHKESDADHVMEFIEALPVQSSDKERIRSQAVEDRHLTGVESYNAMLLQPWFYKLFQSWDYILIFQLDAWIFRDDLQKWVDSDYTYVGAPWTGCFGDDTPDTGVGNGGLSLRAVGEMGRILSSPEFRCRPVFRGRELLHRSSVLRGYKGYELKDRSRLFCRRLAAYTAMNWGWHNTLKYYVELNVQEDWIVSVYAKRVYPWIRIPDMKEAAGFAIETNPRITSERFGVECPFGCHAWEKYDKAFWLETFPEVFGNLD